MKNITGAVLTGSLKELIRSPYFAEYLCLVKEKDNPNERKANEKNHHTAVPRRVYFVRSDFGKDGSGYADDFCGSE